MSSFKIINKSLPLPFDLSKSVEKEVNENLRLKNRYLDIRSGGNTMRNLLHRSETYFQVFKFLRDNKFTYVNTPTITKSTPEGSRDYVVPTYCRPGKYYALAQSPQIYKELLIIGGMKRYFQFASCYRAEDGRADRQPEFIQIDIEQEYKGSVKPFFSLITSLLDEIFKVHGKTVSDAAEIPQMEGMTDRSNINTYGKAIEMAYSDAMLIFGCDKPDTRFQLFLEDFSKIFPDQHKYKDSIFRGIHITPNYLKNHNRDDVVKKINNFVEQFSRENIKVLVGDHPQGGLYACLNTPRDDDTNMILSHTRNYLGDLFKLKDPDTYHLVWITDFPLYVEEDGKLTYSHHPFTDFKGEEIHEDSVGCNYDIVLNGSEIGGGSKRISNYERQLKVLQKLGMSTEDAQKRFGFLMDALDTGAPDMIGIALGIERIHMMLLNEKTIRDVIAFPKTSEGEGLLERGCPGIPADDVIRDLKLATNKKDIS